MLITHIAHKHLNRAVYEKGGDGGASKAQAKAQQQAIDLQREQWNTVMNISSRMQKSDCLLYNNYKD